MDIQDSFRLYRIDDIPLLVELLRRLRLDQLLDEVIPAHGNTLHTNALTNGEALMIWLVYLLSQGDHRKWRVEEWVTEFAPILETLFGKSIPASDFSDDRLSYPGALSRHTKISGDH